ncbi:hypothetical protein BDZ91DRAFT_768492 [Kalaharituber pfeilii]|nr:hypothetical protein BDZ91DRAFT_768492 [Kalaharituber pfeilii]
MWSTIRDKHRMRKSRLISTIKKGRNITESYPRKLKVPVGTRWAQLSDLQAERLLQLIEDEIDAQVQIEWNEPLERWKAESDELKRRCLKLLQNEPIPNFYVEQDESWSESSHEPDKELEPQLEENEVQSEELMRVRDEESNGSNSNGRAGGGPDGAEGMREDGEDIDSNENEVFIPMNNNFKKSDAIAGSKNITLDESADEESNGSDSNGRAGRGPDGVEGMGRTRKDIDSNENEVFIPMNNNFKKVLEILEVQYMTRPKRGE